MPDPDPIVTAPGLPLRQAVATPPELSRHNEAEGFAAMDDTAAWAVSHPVECGRHP
jgi:hypothetical protein